MLGRGAPTAAYAVMLSTSYFGRSSCADYMRFLFSCVMEGDTFESRLEDAVQYALGEVKKVGRYLGRNAPYKQSSRHTYVCIAHKFNVTKQALISSIDEQCLESDDEWEGSENYSLHVCLYVFFFIGRGARRKKCTALPQTY